MSEVVLHGLQIYFFKYLSGVWGQLVFRFILGVGVCAFPHVLWIYESKKIAAHRRSPEDNFWNSPNELTVVVLSFVVGSSNCNFHLYT